MNRDISAVMFGALFLATYAVSYLLPSVVIQMAATGRSALRALSRPENPEFPQRIGKFRGLFLPKQMRDDNRKIERTTLGMRLTRFLQQGGSRLLPVEFLGLLGLASIAGEVIVGLSFRSPVAALAGLLVGPLGIILIFRLRSLRRRREFEAALPDMLWSMANSLRAGYSTMQALDNLGEFRGVTGRECEWAMHQVRLGIPMEEALREMAGRVMSRDMTLVAIVISVHQATGGDLAGLLQRNAGMIRERLAMRGDIRAATAQGRMSAMVLAMLPVFMAVLIFTMVPDSRTKLLSGIGLEFNVLAAVLDVVGALVLMRISRID